MFVYVLLLNLKAINQESIGPSDTQKPWLTWETTKGWRKKQTPRDGNFDCLHQ